MTIAKAQSTSGAASGNATSFSKAYASNNTAGGLLLAVFSVSNEGSGVPTISDSQGNAWTAAVNLDGGNGKYFGFAYVQNCKAGANTVTITTPSGFNAPDWTLAIYEFSGAAAAGGPDHSDVSVRYFPATTTPTTTAFTASQNGALYFGALMTDTDPGTIAKDAAWSQGETPGTFLGDEYLIQSSAASLAADWTTVSTRGSWYIYVFLPATASLPTVTTSASTSVNATNAIGNGNVTSDGGATITERGCVWAPTSNPTTANNKVTASGTTGSYTATMDIGTTGAMLPSTTYHYRAYAINSVGTSYGADTTFTTLAPQNFADSRCVIAKNTVSAQNEAESWNVAVLAALYANLGNIVRTSDHVVTATLPAVAAYAITAPETITCSTTAAITQGAYALTGVPTIVVSPASGSVATITNAVLSRDIFHAGGGQSMTITGLTGVSGTPTVTVNGVACTVTGTTSTTLTMTMPALAGITLPQYVTLIIDGKTFANFNYLSVNFGVYGHPTTFPLEVSAALTTILGRTGFENNAIASADGQLNESTTPTGGSSIAVVTSGTQAPHSGTYCLQQVCGSDSNNSQAYGGGWSQNDMLSSQGGYGRWHRWWELFPAATLTSTAANGQIKLFLSRDGIANFGVLGIGPQFRDNTQDGANVLAVNNDAGNYHINDNSAFLGSYGVEPTIIAATWNEIMVWEYRDDAAGVGHLKAYWNGKKIADTLYQNAGSNSFLTGMGSDTPGSSRGMQIGPVYSQAALNYPMTLYTDDVLVGNGAPNSQDV